MRKAPPPNDGHRTHVRWYFAKEALEPHVHPLTRSRRASVMIGFPIAGQYFNYLRNEPTMVEPLFWLEDLASIDLAVRQRIEAQAYPPASPR